MGKEWSKENTRIQFCLKHQIENQIPQFLQIQDLTLNNVEQITAHWAHIIVFRCLSLKHSLLNPMWTHTHQISTTLVPISQQHSQLSDWHTKLSSCKFYGPTYVRNLKLSILITATRTSASLFYRRCGDWLREAQRRRKERKLLEQLNG